MAEVKQYLYRIALLSESNAHMTNDEGFPHRCFRLSDRFTGELSCWRAQPTHLLWRQPRQVAWEGRCEPDIVHAGQLHEKAFKADGEATVLGHAVLESFQISFEWFDG